MNRRRVKDLVLRAALLFGLAMALVAGFWWHGEFYKFGLTTLLVIGGALVVAVILVMRFAFARSLLRPRLAATVTVPADLLQALKRGAATGAVLPADAPPAPADSLWRLRDGAGNEVRRYVVDARRVLFADLTSEDAAACAYPRLETARKAWRDFLGPTTDDRPVTVVQFAPEASS